MLRHNTKYMNLSRNNHYVPQMYLARWENNKRIYVYSILVSNERVPIWRARYVKGIAYIRDLYVSIQNDKESDWIEHMMDSEYETRAQAILDKICRDDKLESYEWDRIVEYIVAQFVRTPAFFLRIREIGDEGMLEKQIGQVLDKLSNLDRNSIPQEISIGKEANLLPIKVTQNKSNDGSNGVYVEVEMASGKGLCLYSMVSSLDECSGVKKHFEKLKWTVVTTPDEYYWPTSDTPVVICKKADGGIKRVSLEHGIDGKDKMVLFPVSPTIVLIGETHRHYLWRIKADLKMADMIREAIVQNAMLDVYSYFEDQTIPLVRPRKADADEYNRVQESLASWHKHYKEFEGPLLRR